MKRLVFLTRVYCWDLAGAALPEADPASELLVLEAVGLAFFL